MGAFRIVTIYALILLNILGALYAETYLNKLAGLELLIIASSIIFAFILMIALAVEARWSWPIGIIYFSLALANNTLLFALTKHSLTFLFTAFLNLLGFIICAVSAVENEENNETDHTSLPEETYEEELLQPVETYDVPKQKKAFLSKRKS